MEKFRDKYRIPSVRLRSWDYGSNAAYFVTICTGGRECYFGEIIIDGTDVASLRQYKNELSEIGQLAHKFWIEIPQHFPFVELDEFVVMPNHIHGIIIINKKNGDGHNRRTVETPNLGVSTTHGGKNQNWKPGILGVIVNQYKRIVTINARKIHADFEWQSRFHDHIIRNDESFHRIRNYICNNPAKWSDDKFFH